MSIPKLPPKFTAYTVSAIVANQPDLEYYDVAEIEAWHAKVFEGAIEVYDNGVITGHEELFERFQRTPHPCSTKTGLLINIQPIKEETAEDILKEIVATLQINLGYQVGMSGEPKSKIYECDLLAKAKAYLERKKD